MKSAFITTKLRKTENVDWSASLGSYLRKIYGNFNDFSTQINTINKLRIDIVGSNSSIHHEGDIISHESTISITVAELMAARDEYYKYFGQLELIDLRLPINETGVKIKFTWTDAYDKTSVNTQSSLAFEKASILFNLGSILSEIASLLFIKGEFKQSFTYFQYSSGVYKFIAENFLHAPSQELSGALMNFLMELNLAQAQEVFLLKLIKEDPSKGSLIAKLSIAASNYYESCATMYESLNKLGDLSKWMTLLKFKKIYYKALSYYYYAISIQDKKIGLAIALLQIALDLCDELRKTINLTTIDYKAIQTLIEEKLKLFVKDNDYIYNQLIPSEESIDFNATIKPLVSCKPILINDHEGIAEIIGDDLFEKIIPMAIHEKLSLYSEEVATMLREEIDKYDTSNIEYESFLEYLNLPTSLKNLKNPDFIDPKYLKYVENLQGFDPKQDLEWIEQKRFEILSKIKHFEQVLENEEKNMNNMNIIQQFREQLMNLKNSVLNAKRLDDELFSKIDVNNINYFKSEESLKNFVNNEGKSTKQEEPNLLDFEPETSSNSNIAKQVEEIEKSIAVLNNYKIEKTQIIKDLKQSVHDDDISKILILNSKKNYSEKELKILFTNEMNKFDPLITRLNSIIFNQTKLIKNVTTNFDKLIGENSKVLEKTTKLKQIDDIFNNFQKFIIQFKKSFEFYNNLVSFINQLSESIDKFVSDGLSNRVGKMNLGQAQAAPPSQPQPQQFQQQSQPQFQQFQEPNRPSLPPKTPSQETVSFYNTPSTFDQSMYSKFGRPAPPIPQQEPQSQRAQPQYSQYSQYSQPYDPSNPNGAGAGGSAAPGAQY